MDTAALKQKATKCRRLAREITDKRAIEALVRIADECDALLLGALEGEHTAARAEPIMPAEDHGCATGQVHGPVFILRVDPSPHSD